VGTDSTWIDDPIGPEDCTIRTRQGTVAEPDSWLVLTHDHLRDPDDFVTVSSGPPHLYAQAFNDAGRLLLEYRDGSPDRHFQTSGVAIDEVATALEQWFLGRREFIGDHAWTRIET
jgi:hypothetical protein